MPRIKESQDGFEDLRWQSDRGPGGEAGDGVEAERAGNGPFESQKVAVANLNFGNGSATYWL